ncbi:YciI family protein [Marinomonas posidonica]|uniref:YCII-related protein n=1 Tax=Marinomonas posidonica (strain CECT 7376 / NCIMB 14433 / IVIA-Po-181) TaxID=491952 RepID=F6CSR9_MARPP|nr:YciI family protein [Marinomonas posidonica]AEF53909.1 YCII-related protein [Marinomonas posidonica IVIA-Po-181]
MLYSIVGQDVANSLNARQSVRPAHLERLEALQKEGRLVLAGPNPAIESGNPGEAGFTGSIIIAEFTDFEAAKAWAEADPYVDAGVYEAVEVKPFKQVFPN